MTQQNNLQRAKEDARKSVIRFNNRCHTTPMAIAYEQTVDEIVTSTYLQAVEDCLQECNESDHLDDAKTYINQILQSLKQTKD